MEGKEERIELKIPPMVHVNDYEVGVIVVRMQVPTLHTVHRGLIQKVCNNHKKVIIFLGVPIVEQTFRNPLDFASRKAMIQSEFPDVTILPVRDQRDNKVWSRTLDQKISEPFGNRKSLLYGSRDSFIPFYHGRHQTVELIGNNDEISGTTIRDNVSKEIINSPDFRKGVIYANYGRYPVIMPCADIVVYNPVDKTILLGRKPAEDIFRFVGGHVEVTDESYEHAALKELSEETGGGLSVCESAKELTYICSGKIDDWRHSKESSEIFSTLFLATRMSGIAVGDDDLAEVKWFKVKDVIKDGFAEHNIVPEHIPFFVELVTYLKKNI